MLQVLLTFGLAALASFLLTRVVRQYTLHRAILDHPNDRSMHETPVARGGGLAIVTTVLVGLIAFAAAGVIGTESTIALAGGGALVALVGWIDDLRAGIPALVRVAIHVAAAVWAIAWLGGFPQVAIGATSLGLGAAGPVLAVIGIVWWINLYNFMDGIDGIAAGEALSVATVGAALLLLLGDAATASIAALIAGAAAGFLPWNWSPARIFMGDAGSGFLGFCFAVLAIASERVNSLPLLLWLVLSGVFIFDATVTLVRRILRGERFYSAHRSHAYQRLVASGYRHTTVTRAVLVLNVGLAMLALVAVVTGLSLPITVVCALIVLATAYFVVERRNPMRQRPVPAGPLGVARDSYHD